MKSLCNNIEWYRRRFALSPVFILPRALFTAPGVNDRKAFWRAIIESYWRAEWSRGCQEVIKVTQYGDLLLMAACGKPSVRRKCEVRMKIFDAACPKKKCSNHHLLRTLLDRNRRDCYKMWWKRTSTQINAKIWSTKILFSIYLLFYIKLQWKNIINKYIKLCISIK